MIGDATSFVGSLRVENAMLRDHLEQAVEYYNAKSEKLQGKLAFLELELMKADEKMRDFLMGKSLEKNKSHERLKEISEGLYAYIKAYENKEASLEFFTENMKAIYGDLVLAVSSLREAE
jgi:hypothetical protein